MFEQLPGVCKNIGSAYKLTTIIGDAFCPHCGTTILMSEPKAGDYFFGQCTKCGHYMRATIQLSKDGKSGKFVGRNK